MHYQSTRSSERNFSFFDTVREGIAPDGGLFIPSELPVITRAMLASWRKLTLQERAARILRLFAPELTDSLCNQICSRAFSQPLREEEQPLYTATVLNRYLSEPMLLFLDRGATSHYADLTQRFGIACLEALPCLDEHFLVVAGETIEEIKALAAIAPETERWSPWLMCDSKAVNESDQESLQYLFEQARSAQSDRPGTDLEVGAADESQAETAGTGDSGDSEISLPKPKQEILRLLKGRVTEIEWSIYDLMCDQELRELLAQRQIYLAVTGSLSLTHQLALVILLISAYLDLLEQEALAPEEPFELAVPAMSLDFVYAGQLIKRLGLPLTLIYCASNRNKIAADFFRNGRYRLQRKFFRTNSPQLDRLVCQNLERVVFELTEGDTDEVLHQMISLRRDEQLELKPINQQMLNPLIAAGYADVQMTTRAMRDWYDRTDYLFDPYTAVSLYVWERQKQTKENGGKCLVVACESPLLSAAVCAEALLGKGYHRGRSQEVLLQELAAESDLPIPAVLNRGVEQPAQRTLAIDELKEELIRSVCEN